MGVTLATVTFQAASGFPEDNVTNSWCIVSTGDAADLPGEITFALDSFYNVATGQVTSISSYLSGALSRAAGAALIDLYDITDHLDGSSHGPPFFSDAMTLDAAGAADRLPSEVALCLTIAGAGRSVVSSEVADDLDPEGPDPGILRDRPKQRRTGRVYLGPFSVQALDGGTARPQQDLMDDILVATFRMATDLSTPGVAGPHAIGVWSRVNAIAYIAYGWFVDNAFDTQRRRGLAPTARESYGTV